MDQTNASVAERTRRRILKAQYGAIESGRQKPYPNSTPLISTYDHDDDSEAVAVILSTPSTTSSSSSLAVDFSRRGSSESTLVGEQEPLLAHIFPGPEYIEHWTIRSMLALSSIRLVLAVSVIQQGLHSGFTALVILFFFTPVEAG